MTSLRRVAAPAVLLALVASALAGTAQATPAAPAAATPTIVVAYDMTLHAVTATPDSLDLRVGDTFKVTNTMSEGQGNQEFYVAVINGTGSVRMGTTVCNTATACQILDDFPNNPTQTFTAVSGGAVRVIRYNGLEVQPVTRVAGITISAPETRSLTITGERGTVSGKPGIHVYGESTGFAAGDVVNPYVKFAGQTDYTQGLDITVAADGSFTWSRKTGKKVYVYFKSADGNVKSATVIIPTA